MHGTRPVKLFVILWAASAASAAPVPSDPEPGKPRPRLVATGHCDWSVAGTVWTPDGKHLILQGEGGKCVVVRRDQLTAEEPELKRVSEFRLPAGANHLALSPNGEELYSLVPARRFNSEGRLYFWRVQSLTEIQEAKPDRVKPDRVVSLEPDLPASAGLSADGKYLLTHVLEPRPAAQRQQNVQPGVGGFDQGSRLLAHYIARFLRVRTKTGDVSGEPVVFDDPQVRYAGHAVDAKAGRLFVALHTDDETVVRCLDSVNGKQVWETKLPQRPVSGAPSPVLVSPDGQWVGVVQSVLVADAVVQQGGFQGGVGGRGGRAAPPQVSYTRGAIPVLLNAKTGMTDVELPTEGVRSAILHDFSADGRLLIGAISTEGGASQVVVWDTKSGKVVKTWGSGRSSGLYFAFAPSGHELAVTEVESTPVYGQATVMPESFDRGGGGQRWSTSREVIRTDHKTVIGIWDLSPLAK